MEAGWCGRAGCSERENEQVVNGRRANGGCVPSVGGKPACNLYCAAAMAVVATRAFCAHFCCLHPLPTSHTTTAHTYAQWVLGMYYTEMATRMYYERRDAFIASLGEEADQPYSRGRAQGRFLLHMYPHEGVAETWGDGRDPRTG